MDQCIFCKIIKGEIPSTKVFENDLVYAFRDIQPQAPVHILVVPKKHISSLAAIDEASDAELAACLRACREIALAEGLGENGFRVVSNAGKDACQSVPHLHFHILGGEQMADRMA